MGIKGLHKGLSFCTKKGNIKEFQGRRVAIDTSSWLHRSVYSVSEMYVESTERNFVDPKCVAASFRYIKNRCRELLGAFNIAEIYLVMDGKRCPLKANESADRENRRQENLQEARAHKMNGRRDKAEEKYKMCIKIKDGLTREVMAKLASEIDDCVKIVWSPYEADAQLAKLCIDQMVDAVITEDSDVLVYSAAARVAFPIIFKLDRRSGCCDIISMAWLLDAPPTAPSGNSKSALEALLLNLAFRESRRPGFGVRLFVQGCVLAGCDYAANPLSGVGLVNAFKLVRDNSYRNDSVRFRKVLDSIPRKVKGTVDINKYESTLAKSEAVFYYHVVLHRNGNHKHIAEPRLSDKDVGKEHCATDHSPFLERFGGDIKFLGETNSSNCRKPSPMASNTFLDNYLNKTTSIRESVEHFKPKMPFNTIKKNPYAKSKGSGYAVGSIMQAVASSVKKNGVTATNRFSGFVRNNCSEGSNILKYMQRKDDVRFVKRRFPSSSVHKLNDMGQQRQSLFSLVERGANRKQETNISNNIVAPTGFDYGADEEDSKSVSSLESIPADNKANDRIETHAEYLERHPKDDGNDDSILISKVKNADGTIDYPNTSSCAIQTRKTQEDYISDLGDSDFSPPGVSGSQISPRIARRDDANGRQTQSKYFRKSRARRITLEPADIQGAKYCGSADQSKLNSPERKRRKNSASSTSFSKKSGDSFLDEVVDSPPRVECASHERKESCRFGKGMKLGVPPRRRYGAIEAGFRKQKAQASFGGLGTVMKKNSRLLSKSRLSSTKLRGKKPAVMESFFEPRNSTGSSSNIDPGA